MKLSLVVFILIHLFSSFRYNILGLLVLDPSSDRAKINCFGSMFIDKKESCLMKVLSLPVFNILEVYNLYTGTNRGYTFYSPNISPISGNIMFFGDDNQILNSPLQNVESKTKFMVLTNFLLVHLKDEKIRNQVLKPIALRMFILYPDISKLNVWIKLYKIPSLRDKNNVIDSISVNAFTITRKI